MTHSLYSKIISLNNLFLAYYEFRKGKRHRAEVAFFEINLEENIFALHQELKNESYNHNSYFQFKINDPKPRIIHKATVKDRITHQAIYRVFLPIFEKTFIYDSYSSRLDKGTHKAINRLSEFTRITSKNYKESCFSLKIDIKQFFRSIDHQILLSLVQKEIQCSKTIQLTQKIINSFGAKEKRGLPLGNVTSQLFANIYLNELDHYIKDDLDQKYYIRYCDDIIITKTINDFYITLLKINKFLDNKLRLIVKPYKLKVRKLHWGFDYLGYIILPHHIILRPKTKHRMLRKINITNQEKLNSTLQSYFGLLKHCESYKIKQKIFSILKEKNARESIGIRT